MSSIRVVPCELGHPPRISDFEQQLFELALESLGPYGQFTAVDPERLDSRIVTYSGSRRDVGVRVSLVPRGDDLRGIVGDPDERDADRVLELSRGPRAAR